MGLRRAEKKSFPLWFRYTDNYHEEYIRCLGNLSYTEEQTNDYELITPSSAIGASAYVGSVMATNGHMYFVPFFATQGVMKLNIGDNTTTFFGSPKYTYFGNRGGVLAPNGKIYCIPTYHESVTVIDTNDDTVSFIDTIISGHYKWIGGVLLPNGKIYCAPYQQGDSILIIDTNDDSFYTIPGGETNGGGGHWISATLASDGKTVYCAPYGNSQILKIDTETDTVSKFGSFVGAGKYSSSITIGDFIYFVGYSATNILKLDTNDDSTTTIPFAACSGGAVINAKNQIVGSNGSTVFYVFDVELETFVTVSGTGGAGIWGATLGTDGRTYFTPYTGTKILTATSKMKTINENFPLSPFNNKF
jgi:streptogramin lyase